MDTAQQQRPPPLGSSQPTALPPIASLTSNLAPAEQSPIRFPQQSEAREARDSGNWSISQSKHSSGVSNVAGLQLQTILNADESPMRMSVPDTPSSARHPYQAGHALPPIGVGQNPDNRLSTESSLHFDSRRSSVDSRMNSGLNHLTIGPSSPYDSQNASRASLVGNLQQQRGIAFTEPRPGVNGTTPLSPLGPANGVRANHQPRRAPVINPNPRSVSGAPDPLAAAPTKGYAWAFPGSDPDERRRSTSSELSVGGRSIVSRQNSYAASVNSTAYTVDSTLPNGQQRLDDDIATTHHHSMQHRNVTNLQGADLGTPGGSGNYSRTPELRVSHKMAERKRRSEMKGLFDQLNALLPNGPSSKSSKWEILTRACEYIEHLEGFRAENAMLRPEAENYRHIQEENERLRSETSTLWQHCRRVDPSGPQVFGSMTGILAQQQAQNPAGPNVLPPLQHQQAQQPQPQQQAVPASWGAPPPAPAGAMQGVEYGGLRPYER